MIALKTKEKKEYKDLLKEYIIDSYKNLILNVEKFGIDEILDNYIPLVEYFDVLEFADLKECYLWQRKFKEIFAQHFDALFDEEEMVHNNLIENKDKEFYKFFSSMMEFEIEKEKLHKRIKNGDEAAKQELVSLYEDIRKIIKNKKYNKKAQKYKDKLHNPLLTMMSTTLKFDKIDGYQFENYYASESEKNRRIKSLYHESIGDELQVDYNFDEENSKKLQTIRKINGPVIFAVNHTNSHDIPLACKVIGDRASVLAGDEIRYDINGLLLTLNDVTWVTRHDDKSRWNSKYDICLKLFNNLSNIMFVEGTWNMTENKPMLPFNWGIIEIAQISECPIVPLVLEYTPISCIIKIGEPIFISIFDDKKKAIDNLRDIMSTMRWYIWERKTIMSKEEFCRDYVDKHLKEYPKLDVEYEKSIIFQINDTEEKVFEPINKLSRKKQNK